MDPAADKALSVNEVWLGLTDSRRRTVCDVLATYRGPDASEYFEKLVHEAHRIQLELEAKIQPAATGKRKLNDDDAAAPCAPKKAKVSDATTPLQTESIDIASPEIPFVWPECRQSPIKVGQPTLSSTIAGKSPISRLSLPTTRSLFSPSVRKRSLFSSPLSINTKTGTVAQLEPECDELFPIADRGLFRSQAPHQQTPVAEDKSSDQSLSASLSALSQGIDGLRPESSVYKPPLAGVDMSSLKIPANSNVSVNLNFFQAPSSLHQSTDSGTPRKLKCIQCGDFYMEAQNMAVECRRHTGTGHHFGRLLDFCGLIDRRN